MRLTGRFSNSGLAAIMVLALTSGCASIKDHRGYLADATLMGSIQPGVDNRQSVERTLGRPTFASQFGDPAWYYVATNTAQAPFRTPKITEQTVLKVNFDSAGNVVGVNTTGAEKVVRLSPDSDKTPTLGRDRSFFEDLFGNIGAVGAGGAGAPRQPGT